MWLRRRTASNVSPDSLPDPVAFALSIVHVLEGLDIPYLIGGSFASSIHGGVTDLLERAIAEGEGS